ncbi:hypothetical protein P3L10_021955 [Capsicum annuum]
MSLRGKLCLILYTPYVQGGEVIPFRLAHIPMFVFTLLAVITTYEQKILEVQR